MYVTVRYTSNLFLRTIRVISSAVLFGNLIMLGCLGSSYTSVSAIKYFTIVILFIVDDNVLSSLIYVTSTWYCLFVWCYLFVIIYFRCCAYQTNVKSRMRNSQNERKNNSQ